MCKQSCPYLEPLSSKPAIIEVYILANQLLQQAGPTGQIARPATLHPAIPTLPIEPQAAFVSSQC